MATKIVNEKNIQPRVAAQPEQEAAVADNDTYGRNGQNSKVSTSPNGARPIPKQQYKTHLPTFPPESGG